ncbi:MAG: histidine phosphatase family protein [Chlamydiales bacterium]|nr:histidine phosphatase family protein [Chlamydiales bacterium]
MKEEKKQATLYLVRHGETDWNAEGRIQGRVDRHLNEKGRQQARQVGELLSSMRADAIYASTLSRARQTAEIIASFQNCSLAYDPDLQEAAYGSLEGMLTTEFRAHFKEALEKSQALHADHFHHFKVVPDAESRAEILKRVLPSLQRIALAHPGQTVFVVTHGFVMRAIAGHLYKIDDREIHVPNLGIMVLEGSSQLRASSSASIDLGAFSVQSSASTTQAAGGNAALQSKSHPA